MARIKGRPFVCSYFDYLHLYICNYERVKYISKSKYDAGFFITIDLSSVSFIVQSTLSHLFPD